jgi:hypothetical protein
VMPWSASCVPSVPADPGPQDPIRGHCRVGAFAITCAARRDSSILRSSSK